MKQIIYWGDDGKDSSLYGTHLEIVGGRAIFENPFLPSGNSIKTWTSISNFQARRKAPTLPLLERGKDYELRLLGRMHPQNSLYLKVSFYNRFGELANFTILKDGDVTFTYPLDAFSYQIDLINSGNHRMEFDALLLSSKNEEIAEVKFENIAVTNGGEVLNVIFLESPLDLERLQHHPVMSQLGDYYVLIGDLEGYLDYYLASQYVQKMKTQISEISPSAKRLRLISYGTVGNLAALYYRLLFKDCDVYITNQFQNVETYERIFVKDNQVLQGKLHYLIEESLKHRSVHLYHETEKCNLQEFHLVSPLMDSFEILTNLPFLEEKR